MAKRIIEVPLDGEQVVLVEVDDEDFYQGGDALAPVANVDEMLARAGGSVRSAMDNVIVPTMHCLSLAATVNLVLYDRMAKAS